VLTELVVHNFAIIRHLEIFFQDGLNMVSGETGAGKSILVGAVNLMLGGRASQEMIRTGATEATVEAIFPLADQNIVRERLDEWGLQASKELVIRRSINRSGRNRIFVNDQSVTLQQLQQLAKGLVSVSGQHEHQLLMDPEVHLELLDTFGSLEAYVREVGRLYGEWSATREALHKLRRSKEEKATHLDWMRFQLQEIESAKLQPDEDITLEKERNLLHHAATLSEAAESSFQKLYASRGAILGQLAEIEKSVETLGRIDPTQQPLLSHLEQARIQLEELAHSLQQYAHGISFDPQRLTAVEERLTVLQRLGKKYGSTVEAMLMRLEELSLALSREEDSDTMEERLEKTLEELRLAYLEKARDLSRRRHEVAVNLAGEVEDTLASMDMSRARFAVLFDEKCNVGTKPDNTAEQDFSGKSGVDNRPTSDPTFTASGIDRAEFLLSANPGEDLKPLVKVASGGELSRILLALKSLLSRSGEAETLIFDEVDAGIGGRTAELVGLQLKRLADKHQVICITHLPQIACYGRHHYQVAKESTGEETVTNIRLLSQKERVEELSRMLGGIAISDKTRAHARELLQRGQKGMC